MSPTHLLISPRSLKSVSLLMLEQNQGTSLSITCGRPFIMMLVWEDAVVKFML